MLEGDLIFSIFLPSGWTHVVLNYIVTHSGQGILVYINGGDFTKEEASHSPGNDRLVVGRISSEDDASFDVDEFLFFNEKLNDQEIIDIKNMN